MKPAALPLRGLPLSGSGAVSGIGRLWRTVRLGKGVKAGADAGRHWSTSGTVRSTSFALLPPCDLRPPGNPPELPSPLPVSPIGDPGFEPVTAKPAVRRENNYATSTKCMKTSRLRLVHDVRAS